MRCKKLPWTTMHWTLWNKRSKTLRGAFFGQKCKWKKNVKAQILFWNLQTNNWRGEHLVLRNVTKHFGKCSKSSVEVAAQSWLSCSSSSSSSSSWSSSQYLWSRWRKCCCRASGCRASGVSSRRSRCTCFPWASLTTVLFWLRDLNIWLLQEEADMKRSETDSQVRSEHMNTLNYWQTWREKEQHGTACYFPDLVLY